MLDVHAVEIPRLPDEKLEVVHAHERDAHGDGVREVAVALVLVAREDHRQDGPRHHAEPAVGELLQVKRSELGVELHAPPEVVNHVAARAAVLVGGRDVAFDE